MDLARAMLDPIEVRRTIAFAARTMPREEMTTPVPHRDRSDEFQRVALPHLRAAYQLARWLTHAEHDADDVMQEAWLRAFKYFDGFHGTDARSWLLSIVRNAYYTWREKQPARAEPETRTRSTDEDESDALLFETVDGREPGPDAGAVRAADQRMVDEAIRSLPLEFREAVVLREIEELSYKQIAAVLDVPIGTVMSRLSRGRELLRRHLSPRMHAEDGR